MSDAKHTPTPWEVIVSPLDKNTLALVGPQMTVIATVEINRVDPIQAGLDFDHIVRAVNSHDEFVARGSALVAALREWQEMSRQIRPVRPFQTPDYEDFCKMVKAIEDLNWAIQNARGQS